MLRACARVRVSVPPPRPTKPRGAAAWCLGCCCWCFRQLGHSSHTLAKGEQQHPPTAAAFEVGMKLSLSSPCSSIAITVGKKSRFTAQIFFVKALNVCPQFKCLQTVVFRKIPLDSCSRFSRFQILGFLDFRFLRFWNTVPPSSTLWDSWSNRT